MFKLTESNSITSKEINFSPNPNNSNKKTLKSQLKKKVVYFQDK